MFFHQNPPRLIFGANAYAPPSWFPTSRSIVVKDLNSFCHSGTHPGHFCPAQKKSPGENCFSSHRRSIHSPKLRIKSVHQYRGALNSLPLVARQKKCRKRGSVLALVALQRFVMKMSGSVASCAECDEIYFGIMAQPTA
jgi:hypothetical protein